MTLFAANSQEPTDRLVKIKSASDAFNSKASILAWVGEILSNGRGLDVVDGLTSVCVGLFGLVIVVHWLFVGWLLVLVSVAVIFWYVGLVLEQEAQIIRWAVEVGAAVDFFWLVVGLWLLVVVLVAEVVVEVERGLIATRVIVNNNFFNNDFFRVKGRWDWVNDYWNKVLVNGWLVQSLDRIWIWEVVVVELNVVLVVVVAMIVAWGAEIVLNIEVFVLVEVAFVVNVVKCWDWTLVLRGCEMLNSGVLDRWLHLEGEGLLLWEIYIDVVWFEFLSPWVAEVSIVGEMLMLIDGDSVWVET